MKKYDFIVIAAALAIAGIMCLFLYAPSGNSGAYVKIEIDGKTAETLPLDEDAERVFSTDLGTNTLVIKDGEAYISAADCPDKICVRHSKIHRNGESIICLPHKTVVTVIGAQDGIDAQAG
jgi:hypothetical protein